MRRSYIAEEWARPGSAIRILGHSVEQNAAGGVNGRQIELITYDNQGKSQEGVRAVTGLIDQDHVVAVAEVEVVAEQVVATEAVDQEEAEIVRELVVEIVQVAVDQGKNRRQIEERKAGKNRTFAQLFSKLSKKR